MRNLNIKKDDIKKIIELTGQKQGLNISINNKSTGINVLASTLDALSPNLISTELNNFIREIILKEINEGIGIPFANNRVTGDNLVVRIRDQGVTYAFDENVVTGQQNFQDNKNKVRYQEKILDINKPEKQILASTTISPLKRFTNLTDATIHSNNESAQLRNAIWTKVIDDIFTTLKNYAWSDDETVYSGVESDDNAQAKANWGVIEEVVAQLASIDGIRGFNQKDSAHMAGETFLNKIAREKMTLAIDAKKLAQIKRHRADYLNDPKQESSNNLWGTLPVETYNFADRGIDVETEGFAFLVTPSGLAWGAYSLNRESDFGYALQNGLTISGHYDSLMMEQASKARFIEGDAPVEPVDPPEGGETDEQASNTESSDEKKETTEETEKTSKKTKK